MTVACFFHVCFDIFPQKTSTNRQVMLESHQVAAGGDLCFFESPRLSQKVFVDASSFLK